MRPVPAMRLSQGCRAFCCCLLCVSVSLWFNWSHLAAAEPVIRNVNVRGLQVGATTTIVVDGEQLGKAPRLLLPFDAQQQLKPGAAEKQATFDVTLGGDVVPGYHHLR